MSKYLKILNQVLIENEISQRKLIDIAQQKIGRQDVYVLYSGGKDSGAVLKWAYEQKIPNFKGALAINTTISTPDWLEFVKQETDRHGYDLQILTRPDGKTFEDCALEYGFGGPAMHSTVMRYLKLEPLRAFERKERENKPIFLSGVRMHESVRRFGTVEPITSDHGWFCAPLYNWQTENVLSYVRQNDIRISPAYETLHISGDCLCGCFAQQGEFELIKIFYRDVAERLERLQERVREHGKKYHLWGDNGLELRKQIKAESKQRKADAMICGECSINRPAQFCQMKLAQWREMTPAKREAYYNHIFS